MLDIDEHEDGWLGLSPGIEIDGKALPLAPLLAGLFAHDPRWLSGRLDDIDDHEAVILEDETLGRLRIGAARIKPLVRALVNLFDRPDHDWRLSKLDATRLADLDLPGRGREQLAAIAAPPARRRGHPRRRRAGGLPRRAAPLSARGPGLAAAPGAPRPRRHPRRRHGPGQDRADARPPAHREAGGPARSPRPGGAADLAGVQLAGRGRALRPRPQGAQPARRRSPCALRRAGRWPRRRREGQHRAHHLPAAMARRRAAAGARVEPADPRRGADGEERRQQGRAGDPPAEGPPPPGPHRHAAGEPPRRAVGAVRLPAAGLPRQPQGLHRDLAHADREARRHGPPRPARGAPAPLHPAPAQGRRRHRAAAQDHHRAQRRPRGRPARPLRDGARGDGREGARRDRRQGLRTQPDRDPGCAAEAAPGVLRPAPAEVARRRCGSRSAPSSTC